METCRNIEGWTWCILVKTLRGEVGIDPLRHSHKALSLLEASGHIPRISRNSAVLQCGSPMIVAMSHLGQQWQFYVSRGSVERKALAL